MARSAAGVFLARWVLAPDGSLLANAGVEVARGRIVRVIASRASARRRGIVCDLGDLALLPGFVNAHAHLELSGIAGLVPGGPFPAWVRALIAARAARSPADLASDARAGAASLLAGGATAVGDVDSTGAIARAARTIPLRVRRYRELYDVGDPARRARALRALAAARRTRGAIQDGVSPHAPYTVSAQLWAELARRLARLRVPLAIHWAETQDEERWLQRGSGPYARLVHGSPRRSGLDAIESAGCLGPRTALIHGNVATKSERERVARSGASLVHCPGTHAHFDRAPFDLRAWRKAGVRVALGTDSRASNSGLSVQRELALAAEAHPWLAPAELLRMAGADAARALGLEGRAGSFEPGAWADLVAHRVSARAARATLEELARGASQVRMVWVAGVWVGGVEVSELRVGGASIGLAPSPKPRPKPESASASFGKARPGQHNVRHRGR